MKKLIFISFVLLCTLKSQAQWTHEGPDYWAPEKILRVDSILLTSGGGYLYYSSNNGASWNLVETAPSVFFNDLIRVGNIVIAHTQLGIMKSINGGFHWTEYNQGITNPSSFFSNTILGLPNGKIIVAMPSSGLFESLDTANTWQQISTPFSSTNMIAFDSVNQIIGCSTNN